jgi:uncharacterized protein YigE (DUF2233 family)
MKLDRRNFILKSVTISAGILIQKIPAIAAPAPEFSHAAPEWRSLSKGLYFARVKVFRQNKEVDSIGVVRIQPRHNKIRVFHSYDPKNTIVRTLEEWQKETSALALINAAQYMADPYYKPCALVICDGKQKGPLRNKSVRGMFLSEPTKKDLPQADLIDFDYEQFDLTTSSYTQGIQHWPILLDREGKIKVEKSELRANRTVVAKNSDGEILFFTTELPSFSLYNFGLFLKESNARPDGGFKIHTAMNMDGGREANMVLRAGDFSYSSWDHNPMASKDENTILDLKARLPGFIGVFPR